MTIVHKIHRAILAQWSPACVPSLVTRVPPSQEGIEEIVLVSGPMCISRPAVCFSNCCYLEMRWHLWIPSCHPPTKAGYQEVFSVLSLQGAIWSHTANPEKLSLPLPPDVEHKERTWTGQESYSALKKKNSLCWGGLLLTVFACHSSILGIWQNGHGWRGWHKVNCHIYRSCPLWEGRSYRQAAYTLNYLQHLSPTPPSPHI